MAIAVRQALDGVVVWSDAIMSGPCGDPLQ
jgi:hypothetical protein